MPECELWQAEVPGHGVCGGKERGGEHGGLGGGGRWGWQATPFSATAIALLQPIRGLVCHHGLLGRREQLELDHGLWRPDFPWLWLLADHPAPPMDLWHVPKAPGGKERLPGGEPDEIGHDPGTGGLCPGDGLAPGQAILFFLCLLLGQGCGIQGCRPLGCLGIERVFLGHQRVCLKGELLGFGHGENAADVGCGPGDAFKHRGCDGAAVVALVGLIDHHGDRHFWALRREEADETCDPHRGVVAAGLGVDFLGRAGLACHVKILHRRLGGCAASLGDQRHGAGGVFCDAWRDDLAHEFGLDVAHDGAIAGDDLLDQVRAHEHAVVCDRGQRRGDLQRGGREALAKGDVGKGDLSPAV